MDLNEIAVFVRIVEQRSLTGAARALGLPKSTISRRLSSLEEQLGARLVERTPRNLRPTEAGSLFYERCAPLLAQIDEAGSEVAGMNAAPRGRLRVSAGVDLGASILGPLVLDFLRLHPQVSVELLLTDRAVDLVSEGVDVAIRVGPVRESALIVRKLGAGSGVLCASPAYLDARGAPESPSALADHACIVFSSPPHGPEWTLDGPGGPVTVRVSGPLAVNSLTLAREAALAGLGVARLPVFACSAELASGRLRRVLDPWGTATRPVHAVYPSNRHVTAKLRTFLDFMAGRFAGVPGIGGAATRAAGKGVALPG